MADIDREVAEAMAGMDDADLADLCGPVPTKPAAGPALDVPATCGQRLTGTVVAVGEDEVFLEFDAKSQGVVPKAQFDEAPRIGEPVAVVVERIDASANLLFTNREGAVQRASWDTIDVGSIVQGRVTGMIKGGLELNLNGIRAFMPASQVDIAPMKDISVLLNEVVQCQVIELNRRGRNVLVSRRKLLEKQRKEERKKLLAELEVGQTRKGIVGNIVDFGAFVDLGGVEGLVHIRDLSWGTVDKVSDVLTPGQEVEVQVLQIDSRRKRISLGLKQAQPDPWEGVETRYAMGLNLKVRVVRLADFGAFAELEPGVEGLIPITEMAWTRVRSAAEVVSVGQIVDAVIIRTEPERRRIALSIKQAQEDPWAGVLEAYEPNSSVSGKVTRLTNFGVFVELTPGIEGLIHISELADRRVKSCGEVVTVGQEVTPRVLGIDKENRRISLSLKEPATQDAAPSSDGARAAPPKAKQRKKPLRGGLASHFEW